MSNVRNPRLTMVNASTHSSGSVHQRSFGAAMLAPELFRHGFEFDGLLQHRVIPMPLDKIRAAHEGPVLAGPAVVMPQIEIHKINRMRKSRTGQDTVFAQSVHQVLGGLD